MTFRLANWVRNDIARLRADAYQYFVEINWANVVIGTIALLMLAALISLPFLTNGY